MLFAKSEEEKYLLKYSRFYGREFKTTRPTYKLRGFLPFKHIAVFPWESELR